MVVVVVETAPRLYLCKTNNNSNDGDGSGPGVDGWNWEGEETKVRTYSQPFDDRNW